MNYIQKVIVLSLLFIFNSGVINAAQKMQDAVLLYKQKQFEQAYTTLNEINPKSATVWYNMGNCAYKKDEHDYALACWRCAHANAQGSLKNFIEYNIAVAQTKLNKKSEESFLEKILVLYRSIPLIIFQLIFLISWFLLLAFIKKNKHGTKYRSLFFGLLLCVTIITGIGLVFKYRTINQRRGIVMKHTVSLFAGPDEQYHVLGSLNVASEVIVHEQRPSWCKVSTGHGSGWVVQDSIVVL